MSLKSVAKSAFRVAALVAAAALAGCGMDDVQLNGKIFDAVGLNSTGSVKKEAKLKERQPLVVPPSTEKLPDPNAPDANANQAIAGIQDYDAQNTASKAELERQQAEYCKVHYEDAKTRGDDNADLATGPLGPCRASVFTAIKKWNEGDDGDAEQ